jgi:hypothetical protein
MRLQVLIFMKKKRLAMILLGCILLVTTACGEQVERICETPTPAEGSSSEDELSDSVRTDNPQTSEDIQTMWQAGPHSKWLSGPDPEFGTDCIKCHAPVANFISAQIPTLSRTSARTATDLTADCRLCHPQISAGSRPEVAWLVDVEQAQYAPVDAIDKPCKHCHVASGVNGHLFIHLDGVHADFLCTDCHDSHTTVASCSDAGCHQPFRAECEAIQTHDKPHAAASCSACHASGDVEIGWDEERQAWHSFYAMEVEGMIELEGQTSHDLELEVDCERCHTPGELPWDP